MPNGSHSGGPGWSDSTASHAFRQWQKGVCDRIASLEKAVITANVRLRELDDTVSSLIQHEDQK